MMIMIMIKDTISKMQLYTVMIFMIMVVVRYPC